MRRQLNVVWTTSPWIEPKTKLPFILEMGHPINLRVTQCSYLITG